MNDGEMFRERFKAFAEKEKKGKYCSKDRRSALETLEKWIGPREKLVDREKVVFQVDNMAELDEYLRETHGSKETAKEILVGFSDYCKRHGYGYEETDAVHVFPVDDPARRQIELIRFLQKPRTMQQISDHFGISVHSAGQDILRMEQGIEFMGMPVELRIKREKRRFVLQAFIHPMFLGLNNAELLALLDVLARGQEDPLYGVFMKTLSKKVIKQMTPEAVSLSAEPVANLQMENLNSEDATEMAVKDVIITMLNSGVKGSLKVYTESGESEISYCCVVGYDHLTGQLNITKADGTTESVSVNDVFDAELDREDGSQ